MTATAMTTKASSTMTNLRHRGIDGHSETLRPLGPPHLASRRICTVCTLLQGAPSNSITVDTFQMERKKRKERKELVTLKSRVAHSAVVVVVVVVVHGPPLNERNEKEKKKK